MRKIQNGMQSVVQQIADLKVQAEMLNREKAPINNMESADYNLREQLYTFKWMNLTYRYSTDGIFKTLIHQPVLDALKDGINIKSDLLDENDINLLEKSILEKRILNKVKELFTWNRLYGGSALILEVEGQETNIPLNINNLYEVNKVNYYVVNRWELSNTGIVVGNQLQQDQLSKADDDYFYYYGKEIDKSRLIILKGVTAPVYVKLLLQGWGLSVCEPLIAPSNAYQKTMNLIYELIDESKLDVYQVEGLKESVGAGQEKLVIDQIQLTNILKNFQNALVLDKNDTFEQKQLQNLNGIVEVLHELKLDICSAVKIPAVILWGMSPTGFSSGEFDLKSYYSNIESELRPEIKQVLLKILKIECRLLFGSIPEDLDIEFKSLLIQSEEQIQNNKDKIFNRALQLLNNQLITKKEFFDNLKQEEVFYQKVKSSEEDEYLENQTNQQLDFGNENSSASQFKQE